MLVEVVLQSETMGKAVALNPHPHHLKNDI